MGAGASLTAPEPGSLQLKLSVTDTAATATAVTFETLDEKLHLAQRRNHWPHSGKAACKLHFDDASGKLIALLLNGSGYQQGDGSSVLHMTEWAKATISSVVFTGSLSGVRALPRLSVHTLASVWHPCFWCHTNCNL